MYARIYNRGHWGKWHITEAGIRTVCGLKLGNVQAVVKLADKADKGDVCRTCEANKGDYDRW